MSLALTRCRLLLLQAPRLNCARFATADAGGRGAVLGLQLAGSNSRKVVCLAGPAKTSDCLAAGCPPPPPNALRLYSTSADTEDGQAQPVDKDAISRYLAEHEIKISDEDGPSPILKFSDCHLPPPILDKLLQDYTSPTPIQAVSIPIGLDRRNLVGIAQTGSGKTLAYLLPALEHIRKQRQEFEAKGEGRSLVGNGPLVIILAPTRELAQQIEKVAAEYRRIAKFRTVCCIGGESRGRQLQHYDDGAQLMVATPGRLVDFLEAGDMTIKSATYVVLDEADRMLDMGFEPQVRRILEKVPSERQILMFSATWPVEIQDLANEFLGDYTFMNIGSLELSANRNVHQIVEVVEPDYKTERLFEHITDIGMDKTLIFAERKSTVDRLERMLRNRRIRAMAIHGDKSQMQRSTVIKKFQDGSCNILLATDVAARGLDFDNIQYVINYDFPLDIENYIHRIGRTGRGEKKGTSVTLVTKNEARFAKKLVDILKESQQEVNQELYELIDLAREEGFEKSQAKRFARKKSHTFRPSREYRFRGLEDDEYFQESRRRSSTRSNSDYNRQRVRKVYDDLLYRRDK